LVHEVGGDAHGSIEGIIAIAPEVFLTFYSAYPEANLHPQLQTLGVRAIPQADHHEPHPLGRAEWLKLLALMTNRESAAEALFDGIETRYEHIAAIASTAPEHPLVMGGFAAGRDSFEIFGGANQRAKLIADAGGRHISDDRHPGSFVLAPFEAVYARGVDAPAWLGAAPGSASVDDLISRNTLNGWFRASRERAVFAWDRGYTGAWQFPSNEVGMTRPHVFLNEAVRALHPELSPLLPPVDSNGFIRQLP
jgi:iron complex transport system substrate-binding protein